MNSFNHYAYGAIGEWLYRVVAGLEIDEEQPGYRLAVISPVTGGGLTHARGSYDSVYGPVSSAWEKQGNTVTLTAEIPVNARGLIRLECGAEARFTWVTPAELSKRIGLPTAYRQFLEE